MNNPANDMFLRVARWYNNLSVCERKVFDYLIDHETFEGDYKALCKALDYNVKRNRSNVAKAVKGLMTKGGCKAKWKGVHLESVSLDSNWWQVY